MRRTQRCLLLRVTSLRSHGPSCCAIQWLPRNLATRGAKRGEGRGGKTRQHSVTVAQSRSLTFLTFISSRMGRLRHNIILIRTTRGRSLGTFLPNHDFSPRSLLPRLSPSPVGLLLCLTSLCIARLYKAPDFYRLYIHFSYTELLYEHKSLQNSRQLRLTKQKPLQRWQRILCLKLGTGYEWRVHSTELAHCCHGYPLSPNTCKLYNNGSLVDSKGFWRWCITLRITGILGSVV
jgi:hypothetical protein